MTEGDSGKVAYSKNKYHASRTTVNGKRFDSKKESDRWQELTLLERAHVIKDLQRQKKFVLIPAQYDTSGKKKKLLEREVCYYADFFYREVETGRIVVEDVKGYKDGQAYRMYVVKRKLMLYVYGIRIREI